jgi:hypothetical protein
MNSKKNKNIQKYLIAVLQTTCTSLINHKSTFPFVFFVLFVILLHGFDFLPSNTSIY